MDFKELWKNYIIIHSLPESKGDIEFLNKNQYKYTEQISRIIPPYGGRPNNIIIIKILLLPKYITNGKEDEYISITITEDEDMDRLWYYTKDAEFEKALESVFPNETAMSYHIIKDRNKVWEVLKRFRPSPLKIYSDGLTNILREKGEYDKNLTGIITDYMFGFSNKFQCFSCSKKTRATGIKTFVLKTSKRKVCLAKAICSKCGNKVCKILKNKSYI